MMILKTIASYFCVGGLGIAMALAACASSDGGGEKTENSAAALTCPPGYHLGCTGARSATGQCLGLSACVDADGNVAPKIPSPACGHNTQPCCMNPVSGDYCIDDDVECRDSTCSPVCGHLGQVCCKNPTIGPYCFDGACYGTTCNLPDGSTPPAQH